MTTHPGEPFETTAAQNIHEPGQPSWVSFDETRNKADILRYLNGTGWVVSRQTFYNHCNDGKLKVNRRGVYTLFAVRKYAERWLVHSSTGQTVGETEQNLAAQKTMKEIDRIDTSTRHEQFKLDVLMGRYILRSDVEAELAARAVVLDNGLEYMFQASLQEMIALVGGNQQRAPELLEFLLARKNQQMNEYANMGDFKVAIDIED